MIQLKGIDDLLAAGGKPTLLEGEQLDSFLQSLEQSTSFADETVSDESSEELLTTAPFPLEAFPPGTRKFVADVAASVGCPVDFAAIAAIAVAASAIGAARSIRINKSWEEKPIFWAVVVALSGGGKTPAFSKVTAPLFQRAIESHATYKQAKHKYLEDLRQFNKKGGSDDQCEEPLEPPPESQVVVQDITSETISMYLDKNPKGFLAHVDELIGWLGSMDKYRAKGNDRQFWLSLWNGTPIKKDRVIQKGESLLAPSPYVSVLGGVQPSQLSKVIAKAADSDGMMERLFLAFPDDQPFSGWLDNEVSSETVTQWGAVINRLLNLQPATDENSSPRPKAILLDAQATTVAKSLMNNFAFRVNSGEIPPQMRGYAKKLRSYFFRVALVLRLLRWAEAPVADDVEGTLEVNCQDIEMSGKVCEYALAHFTKAYRLTHIQTSEEKQKNFLQWMKKRGLVRVSARDVMRSEVCGVKFKDDVTLLFESLVEAKLGSTKEENKSLIFCLGVEGQ